MSAGPVAVIIEPAGNRSVSVSSRECLNTGRKIATALGCELAAVVMGRSVASLVEETRQYDTDTVYAIDHPLLEWYEPELYLEAFLQYYRTYRPSGILMGHTLLSQDLAPRIAFSLGTGLVTDCTGFKSDPGGISFIKPVYSNNVTASFSIDSGPFLMTVRAKSEAPAVFSAGSFGRIVAMPVQIDRSIVSIEVVERVHENVGGERLQDVDRVVAGGRGIGGPEGFDMLAELAGVLGGALGSSRPPCDMGWISPSTQIGLTGEIVKPSVYIAVGISGSTQHVAGMAGSKTVIAINIDPEANIFALADYGVLGDYREVIPTFTESLRELAAEDVS